jgi:ribosomal protein L21E
MRSFFFLLFLSLSAVANAQTGSNIVAQSTTETTGGLGGYTDVTYAFKQGDRVTIEAKASKQLGLVKIFYAGNKMLGRLKDLKKVNYTFIMPADDSVTFHFVTDRGGTNKINYTISTTTGPVAQPN